VRFANEGARVVVADRANAQETLDLVATSGGTATAIICDVSNPESVAALKTEVESKIGQCDILVNNAGVFPTQRFEDITFEDWRHVLSVNLDSMFLMTRAFAGGMVRGNIDHAPPSTLPQHYITSKAGVIGFTRSIATEFGAQGVTANAIAPGLTRTPGALSRKEAGGMTNDELFVLQAKMQSIKRSEGPTWLVRSPSLPAMMLRSSLARRFMSTAE
jgi:NAD(P)-dependent dehydrogenase (short-subunit alcohol dehydrogenase family)